MLYIPLVSSSVFIFLSKLIFKFNLKYQDVSLFDNEIAGGLIVLLEKKFAFFRLTEKEGVKKKS